MSSKPAPLPSLKFHPLTAKRWHDVELLFGDRGACGGCWCMWWRLKRSKFEKQKGPGNRRALKKIVNSGEVPGIIAYVGAQPVAWCAIASRERLLALERSRVLKRVDDKPVWSVVCFFVSKPFRRRRMTVRLLRAAVVYARKHGVKVVEGYPVELKTQWPDTFAYTGLAPAFAEAGFKEVMRRSKTRPIMRYIIK
ncbi:MAG: GNAT family N-acetyltransferase [Bacteroidota bacterium]